MTVRVLLFDAEGNDTELSLSNVPGLKLTAHQLLWVDIEGEAPPDLDAALAPLQLLDSTVQKLRRPHLARPGLTHHGGYVSLNMNAACADRSFTPLVLVAGENFVVTSHPQGIRALTEFTEQVQGDTQLGKLDSAAFLNVLLSRFLETYFEAVNPIEQASDELDTELLRAAPRQEPLDQLVELRRVVGVLRRELAAHRPVFMHLASPDFVVYAGDEREAQFNTLLVQFDHALETVGHTRELVLASFDLYMSSLSRRTNDIMRVLTVVTLALGMAASVAGLMGMNFQADIFKAGNRGFWDVIVGTGLLTVTFVIVGRWRRWW